MDNAINREIKIKKSKRNKKIRSYTGTYTLLIIISILCAGPFLWLLSTSFKSGQNIYDMHLFFKNPTLSNYTGVTTFMELWKFVGNSLIITCGSIIIDVVFSSLCAYPLACMEFYGKKIIISALLSTMIIPAAAGLVVNYLTIKDMHLMNTFLGVILPGAVSVFSIILLRTAYMGIPKDMIEAAKIDGASEIKIWMKIMVPEVMPAVSTIIIFDFIGKWNAFLWPTIVLQDPKKYPIATALRYLNGQFNYKFGYIAAGTIISIIPVIIIFMVFQKYFISTISGAIKG